MRANAPHLTLSSLEAWRRWQCWLLHLFPFGASACNTPGDVRRSRLPTMTTVAGVKRLSASVCLCLSVYMYVRSIIQQEGWLSPTERASVSAISLRHNLATSGESRRYVVAFTRFVGGGNWLPQESLRHILASTGYAPGTIAVNVTWMKRGLNACQTHHSMYPSIFNRLWAIARYWSEIATFSYPLALEFWEKVWSSVN